MLSICLIFHQLFRLGMLIKSIVCYLGSALADSLYCLLLYIVIRVALDLMTTTCIGTAGKHWELHELQLLQSCKNFDLIFYLI